MVKPAFYVIIWVYGIIFPNNAIEHKDKTYNTKFEQKIDCDLKTEEVALKVKVRGIEKPEGSQVLYSRFICVPVMD
jgi:hypothetical protein